MRRTSAKNLRSRKGFMLVEVATALAICALALPAIAYLLVVAINEDENATMEAGAYFVAEMFTSEMSRRRFKESVAAPGNGMDAGELNQPDRLTLDDVDDFDGFNTCWIRDEYGNIIPSLSRYCVAISVVNIEDRTSTAARSLATVTAGSTSTKLGKVTVSWTSRGETRSIQISKIYTDSATGLATSTVSTTTSGSASGTTTP